MLLASKSVDFVTMTPSTFKLNSGASIPAIGESPGFLTLPNTQRECRPRRLCGYRSQRTNSSQSLGSICVEGVETPVAREGAVSDWFEGGL